MKRAKQGTTKSLSVLQLQALHSLFKLYESRSLDSAAIPLPCGALLHCVEEQGEGQLLLWVPSPNFVPVDASPRVKRIASASAVVGRTIASFSELTSDEAGVLIDALKKALGQKVTPPRSSRRPDRDQARAYGIAGRSDNDSKEIRMVDDATLELMDNLRAKLGWSQGRLDAFLKSNSSPVRGGAIRTLNQANRVIWALKNMMRRAGSVSSNKEDTPA